MRWLTDPLESMRPRRQALWQRLIESTVVTIGRQGYPETTIQDITNHANTSRTQFYFLFEDKEQCFLAAQEAVLTELEARLRAPDYSGLEWPDQVRVATQTLTDVFDEAPGLARLILIESTVAGQEALERYREATARLEPYVKGGAALARNPEALPASVAEMAIGSALAILVRELQDSPEPNFSRLIDQLQFAIFLPFLGPVEAKARSQGLRL